MLPAPLRAVHGRVTVYNETSTAIAVAAPGRRWLMIAPGDDITVEVVARDPATVTLQVGGRRRTYVLDLGLLGYDTIHVRPHHDAAPGRSAGAARAVIAGLQATRPAGGAGSRGRRGTAPPLRSA